MDYHFNTTKKDFNKLIKILCSHNYPYKVTLETPLHTKEELMAYLKYIPIDVWLIHNEVVVVWSNSRIKQLGTQSSISRMVEVIQKLQKIEVTL